MSANLRLVNCTIRKLRTFLILHTRKILFTPSQYRAHSLAFVPYYLVSSDLAHHLHRKKAVRHIKGPNDSFSREAIGPSFFKKGLFPKMSILGESSRGALRNQLTSPTALPWRKSWLYRKLLRPLPPPHPPLGADLVDLDPLIASDKVSTKSLSPMEIGRKVYGVDYVCEAIGRRIVGN